MAEHMLLEVKNLKIALKADKSLIPIVNGVDLSLGPGKVLGLVGESGCGKSVTALSLLRLLPKELTVKSCFTEKMVTAPLILPPSNPGAGTFRASVAERSP